MAQQAFSLSLRLPLLPAFRRDRLCGWARIAHHHHAKQFHASRNLRAIDPPPNAVRVKSDPVATVKSVRKLQKIIQKLPPKYRPYAEKLLASPGSYVFSFLLLHEVTAVLPLFGLTWLFQATDWIPPLSDSLLEAGKTFYANTVPPEALDGTDASAKLLLRGATAYAIIKAILPLRIIFCVWATPWFARKSVLPIVNGYRLVLSSITKRLQKKSGLDFTRLPKK
ncbi:hypothetical protein V1514DRAFT_335829 [Lipomyces japonicus]|uniref:uncharacterized protein n=1 Tax=Lipomyces japonicus TaxID=56871 RepID=UPI0034CF261F